jgi:hypothetical protein
VVSALRWTAPALPLLPLVVPLLVNLRAFGWSLDAADAVAAERDTSTWDLLRVLPQGGLRSGWIATCGRLHRHGLFDALTRLIQIALFIGGGMVATITLVAVVAFEPGRFRLMPAEQQPAAFMIASVAGIALLYADFTQTVVLSAVTGLYAGVHAHNRADARAFAASLFAVTQAAIYLLTALFGLLLVPSLFARLGWTGMLPLVALLLIRFALLCGSREIVLLALWRRLTAQLGGESLAAQAAG